jgi:hypothetical protein
VSLARETCTLASSGSTQAGFLLFDFVFLGREDDDIEEDEEEEEEEDASDSESESLSESLSDSSCWSRGSGWKEEGSSSSEKGSSSGFSAEERGSGKGASVKKSYKPYGQRGGSAGRSS